MHFCTISSCPTGTPQRNASINACGCVDEEFRGYRRMALVPTAVDGVMDPTMSTDLSSTTGSDPPSATESSTTEFGAGERTAARRSSQNATSVVMRVTFESALDEDNFFKELDSWSTTSSPSA